MCSLKFDLILLDAKNLLKEWREEQTRSSEDVVEIWETILEPNINSLGSEKYAIMEQVFVASLDVRYFKLSDKIFNYLSKQFPGGLKILCLRSMHLQALGLYPEATRVLDLILSKDPNDFIARKRKISILKDLDKIVDAVKELVEYLKMFPYDFEAWQELSDMYLNENELQKAAHCIETIILHNPNDHLWLQRYADIKYTQGGYDNYEMARIYYLSSLKICKTNLRALYGLNLVCNNLLASSKTSSVRKKLLNKYVNWSTKKICKTYRNNDQSVTDDKLSSLMSVLQV